MQKILGRWTATPLLGAILGAVLAAGCADSTAERRTERPSPVPATTPQSEPDRNQARIEPDLLTVTPLPAPPPVVVAEMPPLLPPPSVEDFSDPPAPTLEAMAEPPAPPRLSLRPPTSVPELPVPQESVHTLPPPPLPGATSALPEQALLQTALGEQVQEYLNGFRTTDQLEHLAARIVSEVTTEGEPNEAKINELRLLVFEQLRRPDRVGDIALRVQMLDAGLALVMRHQRNRDVFKSALIIGGVSVAGAAWRGFHLSAPTAESATRIAAMVQRFFQRLTPEQNLARDLSSLLRGRLDIANALGLQSIRAESSQLQRAGAFQKTQQRHIEMSMVEETNRSGYFIFWVTSSRPGLSTGMFRSRLLPEREFTETRSLFQAAAREPLFQVPAQRPQSFDRDAARRSLLGTGGRLGLGYAITTLPSDSEFSETYLRSLLSDTEKRQAPDANR